VGKDERSIKNKNTTMSLLDVRKEIDSRLRYLPDWIDTKSPTHKKVWHTIEDCHEILFVLVVNMILSEKAIEKISRRFDEYIEEFIDLIDGELQILLHIYFISVIEYMTLVCIENEEYEAATNLRNFNDFYFQQNKSDMSE
jgi:hypothetical protein